MSLRPLEFVIALICLMVPVVTLAQSPAPIAFVQGNSSAPQTPQSTVTVPFMSAQTAGNLNVVIVGWNDSAVTVTSIGDSKGNVYTRAVGPTVRAGQASQSIYYSPNIVSATANSNIVTVNFSGGANYPDVRALEYSGLDPVSPLVGGVGATGSSATTSSGALTTTVPNVLLVAGNVVQNGTTGPGAGFTSRMITQDLDIAEDRVVTTTGSYTATAPQSPSGYWVMQMVAFKAAILGTDTTPPTVAVTSHSNNQTVTSSPITVAGTASDSGLGNSGISSVTVNGVAASGGTATGAATANWSRSVPLNPGANTITVVGKDNSAAQNSTTTSITVNYTPGDATGPAVAITSHTNSQTVSTSPITVAGTASDSGLGNSGISSVTVNGVAASGGTATGAATANWSRSVALNPGANTITVVGKDNSAAQNSTTTSITVNYTPGDATGPAVAITSHTNSQTVSTSPITVAGTASDSGLGNSGISSVTVNGVAASGGTATGAATANWSRSVPLNPGANTITVVGKDNSAAQNSTTTSITVNYTPGDATGPAVAITSHTNSQTVSTSPITVAGTASDSGLGNSGISSVTVNGVAASGGTATGAATANWSRSVALNPGANTITVVGKDNSAAQNSTTTSIIVNYTPGDATGPAVAITSHTNSQTVSTSPITVAGTASDSGLGNSGISSVTVNGVAASGGTATGAATANWSRSVALNPGANTITVVGKDNSAAQNSTTTSITVNYTPGDATGPAVAITSHTNSQTVSTSPITVAGTASDSGLGNSGISSVMVNGVAASGGTAAGSATANWSRSVALNPGANTITVVAKDASAAQNSTSTSITVNYSSVPAAINFVQGNFSAPQTPQSAVTVPFTSAQTAGNLNVVIVGWNDSAVTVTSISDSKGNVYTRAVGPTVRAGQASQSIYYSPNIVSATANSNIVTVNFSGGANYPDVRALEYSGLDPVSPLVGGVGATGSSATTSSGALTTTVPNVLLVAGNVVQNGTTGPGAGFTSRMITQDLDIAEDRVVTTTGSYTATAPQSPSGYWVMQMVAFKAAVIVSDTTPPALAITSHTNNQTVTSSPITVAGTASDSGSGNNGISSVTVNGVTASGGTATGAATANWTRSVALNPGANTITVVARDASTNQNLTTVSITVNFSPVSDTTGPTVAITSHTNNQTVTSSPITVAGTASDSGLGNSGISSVTVNGVAASGGTATGSATANWSRSVTLNTGANTITVVAKDASTNQNSSTTQITLNYTPTPDTTGPTVAIASHSNNQTVTSSPIALTGTASDSGLGNNGISSVTVNGVAASGGTATGAATANWSRSVALNSGANTITVVAKDASTNQNSSTTQITLNYSTELAPIAFVQGNFTVPQTPQTTVTVAYPLAQSAGNLNVVLVGWNDSTATVTSVTDTKGNAYNLAVGPTVRAGQAGHAIYYASNIVGAAGNVNVVTVRFNVAAVYPDVRILEYSGLDTVSPFQTAIAANGSSATSNSGTLNVSSSNGLLVAGNVVATATSGAGSGFVNRMITSPNGDIVEDRVVTTPGTYSATAPLASSGYWIMQMVAFGATALPSDSTPPTVSMTSPAANSTVASTVTVAAEASDNINVVGVQFFLDGAPLGSEVTDSPYSVLWNTTAITPGNHSLFARARDGSGNSTDSASISVTVRTTTVADTGQWSAVANWPLVAVHSILLPTGNVLAFDGAAQNGAAYIWNPTNNTFTSKNAADNIFCAGHCLLPDGRVLVVGGHIANFVGIPDANIFNSTTAAWTQIPSMSYGRWYPTAITLPDGRVLVVAGDDGCETCWVPNPEIYNPATNSWQQLINAANPLPEYPHLFVLSDGRVLATGTFEQPIAAQILDVNAQTWSIVDPAVVDGHSSVMYAPDKFMKSGTSATSDAPFWPAADTTYVLDMTLPQPAWSETPPMAYPRSYHTLTILPDGNVLATGGNQSTDPFDQTQAVYPAELWIPSTESWTVMASMSVPRFYHSIALLLPDGRVLVAGGGRFGGTAVDDKLNAQIYSPPYLFKGARPGITSAPNLISYNSSFSVGTASATTIAKVSLIPLGSVTHHFNANQRIVTLPFGVAGSTLSVQAPANANLAPPGYYMFFIVDSNGVPSIASVVRLQ